MAEKTLFYNIYTTAYNANAKVIVDPRCNGVTVVNTGTTNMLVNGIPLAPPIAPQLLGESFSFGGNKEEIFYGRLDIGFTGGAGQCIVVQKFYVEFQGQKPFELK